MIRQILDPLEASKRSVKDWRKLYQEFFAFFAPGGPADETERKAWAIAARCFNTDLVAVCNRTVRVVPMTFQDFVEGIDSFRHDGLREGTQRDIAWQPKKILLLMNALIGRIVAGWQADRLAGHGLNAARQFQSYLVEENRKAEFLGYTFGFAPLFSLVDFYAAGLRPLLHPFPHLVHALLESGVSRCAFCAAAVADNPPLLRVEFSKPMRAPSPCPSLYELHVALIHKEKSCAGNHPPQHSDFEFSTQVLAALAFEPGEAVAVKCGKLEQLFELAATDRLVVCGPFQAQAPGAARLAKVLGRTPAEQFALERFFALGFKSGQGNEPWLQTPLPERAGFDVGRIKKARKQFEHWRDILLFFDQAGRRSAAETSGARLRQEALQPKGSATFLALLNLPAYAPLMGTFVSVDAAGGWLVEEPELREAARRLHRGAGQILLDGVAALTRCAESLPDETSRGRFLFNCAEGLLMSLTGKDQTTNRWGNLAAALEVLREQYQPLAPGFAKEFPARAAPTVHLESREAFEQSMAALSSWVAAQTSARMVTSVPQVDPGLAGPIEALGVAEASRTGVAFEPAASMPVGVSRAAKPSELGQETSAAPDPGPAVLPEAEPWSTGQAQSLLRDYADELCLPENHLMQEFLQSVAGGSEAAFKRKEKLKHRLEKRTRWGGRDPYKTTLKLLERVLCDSR